MNPLKTWMAAATPAEKARLARLAHTSVGTLRQIAGAYRTAGRPNSTPQLARRIEIASSKLERDGLPILKREQLCQACGRCEFARQARSQP